MASTYPKATGSAGSKGVDFQVNLLSVFLLNALRQNIEDWKLSTENKLAGKFDDVVLELSDGSAILLQAKHKENKKVTLDQLLSTNSKNEDFSLPKYFCSYLDVRTRFRVKLVIICTNTQADPKILKYLNQNSVGRDSMLHCGDGASFFTFRDGIVADLITKAKDFHKINLKGKGADECLITEQNVKQFLKHLQFHADYPSESDLQRATAKLLFSLKSFGNLLRNITYQDLHQKVKDWFEQPKGEYITDSRTRAIFCEVKSEKFRQQLEDYKVLFKDNDLMVADSTKRFFHVVAEGGHLLHSMKVYRSLQHTGANILYAFPDGGADVQEQVIKTFSLPLYTYLIIIRPKYTQESIITEICHRLSDILQSRDYKKIILVAERRNRLAERMKSIVNDYDTFDETLTLAHLSEDTQEMLLRRESIIFQGEDSTLEELFSEELTEDHKKSVKSEVLEKLVRGERVIVGIRLRDLDEDVSRYYIERKFQRSVKEVNDEIERSTETGDIISEKGKMILISDSAGMGKTTVLRRLAIRIKTNNPLFWVIVIELDKCTKYLRDSLRSNRSINMGELLNCKGNELENVIFSLKEKVILMLDGVDEISPDYTKLIVDLLLQSQEAENLTRVYVTTRPHMVVELERHLNVTTFELAPLTERNQIDFFTQYWTYAMDLEGECVDKCKKYAEGLIKKVSLWINERHGKVRLVASPLHARMLAEVFLENQGSDDWQGCKEYLEADEGEPKLPERMNIARLYEMFVEKKRDIFMDKGNPSGNTAANQALADQFEECLAYHRSLALHVIINKEMCALFSCCPRDVEEVHTKVLKMGIVQKSDDKLYFVHRTYAEYFVAESILRELQHQNEDVLFQKLVIDEVFYKLNYELIRDFLDNFLHDQIRSLTASVFRNYISIADDSKNCRLMHLLAKGGNTNIIRLILNSIDFKVVQGEETSVNRWKSTPGKCNTLTVLRYLTERGGANVRDELDWTPLHYAAFSGHLDTAKFLVEMGADINCNSSFLGSALHVAAQRDNSGVVEFLVERMADVNVTNDAGNTALHSAADCGNFGMVQLLVKHKADIGVKNGQGCSALHLAAKSGSADMVQFFLNLGAYINMAMEDGYTALHFAARGGFLDVVELLVERGAVVDVAGQNGDTALHFAACICSCDIFEFLLGSGADIEVPNGDGYAALHFASLMGSLDVVRLAVKHGADVNTANERNGNSALHLAAEGQSCDIVQWLVEHGAAVDVQNGKGRTALHLAVDGGSFDAVEFLVENDADVNIADEDGCTSLDLATRKGSQDVVDLLLRLQCRRRSATHS